MVVIVNDTSSPNKSSNAIKEITSNHYENNDAVKRVAEGCGNGSEWGIKSVNGKITVDPEKVPENIKELAKDSAIASSLLAGGAVVGSWQTFMVFLTALIDPAFAKQLAADFGASKDITTRPKNLNSRVTDEPWSDLNSIEYALQDSGELGYGSLSGVEPSNDPNAPLSAESFGGREISVGGRD